MSYDINRIKDKIDLLMKEIRSITELEEEKDGSGPDVQAAFLKELLINIRNDWDIPKEAFEEVEYVLHEVFPEPEFYYDY